MSEINNPRYLTFLGATGGLWMHLVAVVGDRS